jgi:hypothetical protein
MVNQSIRKCTSKSLSHFCFSSLRAYFFSRWTLAIKKYVFSTWDVSFLFQFDPSGSLVGYVVSLTLLALKATYSPCSVVVLIPYVSLEVEPLA